MGRACETHRLALPGRCGLRAAPEYRLLGFVPLPNLRASRNACRGEFIRQGGRRPPVGCAKRSATQHESCPGRRNLGFRVARGTPPDPTEEPSCEPRKVIPTSGGGHRPTSANPPFLGKPPSPGEVPPFEISDLAPPPGPKTAGTMRAYVQSRADSGMAGSPRPLEGYRWTATPTPQHLRWSASIPS
jgi:hypothetical protein